MANAIFWIIVVISAAMSYSIGANDAANALGTSYGANAAKLWILLGLGAIFELVGAVWCSSKLAGTLADKMLPSHVDLTDQEDERLMLGASLSAFLFIMSASFFGMPISGTHTVIGALIGAGLAGLAADTINWGKFIQTVMSWFISPVLSAFLAGLLFIIICSLTLRGHVKTVYWQLTSIVIIAAISLTFSAYMVTGLAAKETTPTMFAIILPSTFVVSIIMTRMVMIGTANMLTNDKMSVGGVIGSSFAFWSYDSITERASSHDLCEDICSEQTKSDAFINSVVNNTYRILLVQAACLVCLAHGSNDVANSIVPLLVELDIYNKNTTWAYWLGGIGISIGLMTLGYKVMETVGKKVIKLDFYKGFAC